MIFYHIDCTDINCQFPPSQSYVQPRHTLHIIPFINHIQYIFYRRVLHFCTMVQIFASFAFFAATTYTIYTAHHLLFRVFSVFRGSNLCALCVLCGKTIPAEHQVNRHQPHERDIADHLVRAVAKYNNLQRRQQRQPQEKRKCICIF